MPELSGGRRAGSGQDGQGWTYGNDFDAGKSITRAMVRGGPESFDFLALKWQRAK